LQSARDLTLSLTVPHFRGSERYQNVGVLWVAAAIEAIVELVYVYNTMRDSGGNYDQLLNGIDRKLTEVLDKLDEVNRGIDWIIDLLCDLPGIIRGEVENALVKQVLGEATQRVALIQNAMDPTFIERNLDKIEFQADEMQVVLGRIKGLRGVAGVLATAPYLSAWMSAKTAVQKVRRRKDPSWPIQSPWTLSWMKQNHSMFFDLFDQIEVQDKSFQQQEIPNYPRHNTGLSVNGNYFKSDLVGRYRISCPSLNRAEKLQARTGVPERWDDVKPGDGNDAAATIWTREQKMATEASRLLLHSA
jgi:hypothetical protein